MSRTALNFRRLLIAAAALAALLIVLGAIDPERLPK